MDRSQIMVCLLISVIFQKQDGLLLCIFHILLMTPLNESQLLIFAQSANESDRVFRHSFKSNLVVLNWGFILGWNQST